MDVFSHRSRVLLAILIPVGALAIQWGLWPYLKPFVWFLFFPAVFFSARICGFGGGLLSTGISALLVWFFFIPPQLSWEFDNPGNLYSVALFLLMGYLFSDGQGRLRRAQQATDAALAESRAANDKITELYRQTLQLDEIKSQFFANVSHELRTPLTLIMSPLARRLATADISAVDRAEAEMMLRNARLLYHHVSDLLDASKLEAGRMAVDYARLDLGGLVRATAAQFDSLAGEKGVDYWVDVPAVLNAEGDAAKIQRILLNLLSNAFKFTPEGGAIGVRLRDEAGTAILEVQDSGPGVPDAWREAVFERFRQVEGSARRRHGGTGLGLAIVREFAELHGGSASVREAPGGGSIFAVRLPLTAAVGTTIADAPTPFDPILDGRIADELKSTNRAAAAPGDSSEAEATAPLVLVVEDNADMNAFVADNLRSRYRVACAFDGREGLEIAMARRPDLILSDLMMPVMSGDQMVVELRRHPALVDTPIVLLTAKDDDNLKVQLLEQGVQDYLNKPFSVDELLARVASLLASRRRTLTELARSEAALLEAQRLAHIGSWVWDIATDVHTWSAEVYAIYGRDPAQPPAIYPEVRKYFTAESWAYLAATVEQALATGNAYECDAEVVRADGSHRWITARGEATRDAAGTVVGLHGTVQDITGRKIAEEELKRRNEELERFDHAAVGREMAMIRLKQQVNALSRELGRAAPYPGDFIDQAAVPRAEGGI